MTNAHQLGRLPALFTLMLSIALPSFTTLGSPPDIGRDGYGKRRHLLDIFEARGVQAIPELQQALGDYIPTVRRTAAHLLVRLGEPAYSTWATGLQNEDFQVRRIIMDGLAESGRIAEYWPTILLDDNPSIRSEVQQVFLVDHPLPTGEPFQALMEQLVTAYQNAVPSRREHVVRLFGALKPLTPESRKFVIQATRDREASVRRTAFEAILNHVSRDWDEAGNLLAAANADEVPDIRAIGVELRWKLLEVKQVSLPRSGWRFTTDPNDMGRDTWFAPDFNDQNWRTDVPIETSWQSHMDTPYYGIAWYRRTIELPSVSSWDRAYLQFEGVDESAWVWIDGRSVGEHDIGKEGWDKPFVLDVSQFIEPGRSFQLTVKVKNTAAAGGIWRPIRARILDTTLLGNH